jgi:large conductance mechanosensitive channel
MAAVIYFVLVVPMSRLLLATGLKPAVMKTERDCPECLSAVPMAARRCKFCTAVIPPLAPVSDP